MKINWAQLETDNEETIIMTVSYSVFKFFREKTIERKAFKKTKNSSIWRWLDDGEIVHEFDDSLNAIYSTKEKKYVV